MEQNTDSEQKTLSHVQAPGFTSGIATSVAVIGPTPDGYLHLEFTRDVQVILDEPFRVVRVEKDGVVGQQWVPAGPGRVEFRKEVLASMAIQPAQASALGAALVQIGQRIGTPATPNVTVFDHGAQRV